MQKKTPAPVDALLSESFINGRRAGLQGLSLSALQLQPGPSEYIEFMRGFESGAKDLAAQTSKRCRYSATVACHCGGRGLCLDVA